MGYISTRNQLCASLALILLRLNRYSAGVLSLTSVQETPDLCLFWVEWWVGTAPAVLCLVEMCWEDDWYLLPSAFSRFDRCWRLAFRGLCNTTEQHRNNVEKDFLFSCKTTNYSIHDSHSILLYHKHGCLEQRE